MKKALFFLAVLFLASCKKEETYPNCIHDKIHEMEDQIKKVDLYKWDGKNVYVFVPELECCDQVTYMFYSDCQLHCASGGIGGNLGCNASDFYAESEMVETVWEK